MKNRSNNRQSSRGENFNRWEWLQNNPDPFSQQPADSDGKRREGQPAQVPSEGFPDSFGFLGWDEMRSLPPGAQGESGPRDSRGQPFKDTQQDEKGWGPHMNPDAWLDEPLPWEMPPPGSDESRRGEAPWEPSSPRHEKPKQRTDFPASRQESKKTERRESGRDWEDLPSLYDEMEGLDSPRARVKGRRTRGVRSRNRHRKR